MGKKTYAVVKKKLTDKIP